MMDAPPPLIKSLSRPLSEDEENLVKTTPALTAADKRDKLVCCLMLDGIKWSELSGIALPDLRLEFSIIRFPQTIVIISSATVQAMREWLAVRPSKSNNLTLFTSHVGKPVSKMGLRFGRIAWTKKILAYSSPIA